MIVIILLKCIVISRILRRIILSIFRSFANGNTHKQGQACGIFTNVFKVSVFGFYSIFMFIPFSYALYHAARKNLSGVKTSISSDWLDNGTASHPEEPLFPSMASAQNFLGTLDALFMIFYAAALIFWVHFQKFY